jgi:hypothetical protein
MMSNRTYFETELKEWEKEVEETAEYDLWAIEQQLKNLSPELLKQFNQTFGEKP